MFCLLLNSKSSGTSWIHGFLAYIFKSYHCIDCAMALTKTLKMSQMLDMGLNILKPKNIPNKLGIEYKAHFKHTIL